MKMIINMAVLLQLISIIACSQNFSDKILGEWTLEMSDDGDWYPDILIFRSDNKYLVYNDMDFVGMPGTTTEFDIITDNQAATALTETGKWQYDPVTEQLTLSDRNFVKENSLFNDYYGKGERLVFKIKEPTDKKLILCSVQKENDCDTYMKHYNPRDELSIVFYKEITEEFTGTGSQTQEIILSGYETELKLSYEFYKEPDKLLVEDRNGKVLFSTEMQTTTNEEKAEIPLRGVTKLVFKISNEQSSSKWKIKAEVK